MFLILINPDIYEDIIDKITYYFSQSHFRYNKVRSYCTDYNSLMYINESDYDKLEDSDKLVEHRVNNCNTCILKSDLKENYFNILCLESECYEELRMKEHIVFSITDMRKNSNSDYKIDTASDDFDLNMQIQIIVRDIIDIQFMDEHQFNEKLKDCLTYE